MNEVADEKSCSSVLFFEARKRQDLYLWLVRAGARGEAQQLLASATYRLVRAQPAQHCRADSLHLLLLHGQCQLLVCPPTGLNTFPLSSVFPVVLLVMVGAGRLLLNVQAKAPDGPTAKFLVLNVHTMDELKLTGNHLKGSR